MNVLLINGSPHKNGCTNAALTEMAKALNEAGIETTIFHIGSAPVGGCVGCGGCSKAGKCVFGGPVADVLPLVEKADGSEVVYAVEPSSEKEGGYVVTEVPVTTGLETDFYIEVSGDGITDGLSIVSDPQSVAPGMEVTPDFVATGTTPVTTGLSSEPVVGLSSESGAE